MPVACHELPDWQQYSHFPRIEKHLVIGLTDILTNSSKQHQCHRYRLLSNIAVTPAFDKVAAKT